MATYYWVGGFGTWNSTSATNWASTSGGAGGAGYPTILDDVVFDTNSGTGVVSCTNNYAFCRDFTITASQALTFAAGAISGIAGNISLPAGGSLSISNLSVTCIATSAKTITTNGKSISGITFNGINGSWTLQDAFTAIASITVTAGTFNTNNQSVTSNTFTSTGTLTRAINLGSSTFTNSGSGSNLTMSSTGLTFNAGTSTLIFTSGGVFSGGGLTYNNVSYTGTTNNLTFTINDANTFNNLSFVGPTSAYVQILTLGANQTITGTLTLSGPTNLRRIGVYSSVIGTQRTLTVNAWSASPANLDFRDIVIAGAVGTLSGTSFGNCGNNSNITFTAAKTVYWNLAGTQFWSANGWAASSGGIPNSVNFPLVQDTCVFDNTGAMGTVTIEAPWNIGTIDASTRTSGSFSQSTLIVANIYGDVTFGSGMTTVNSTGTYNFAKQGTQTINTNGVSFNSVISINSGTGTLRLLGNLTLAFSQATTLTSGTLDLNNFTFSTNGIFTITANTLARSIAFGTGNITLSDTGGGTYWNGPTLTNFTLTGTPTVNVTGAATASTRTIQHGNTAGFTEANAINVNVTAGSSTAVVSLQGGFRNINLTGYAANFSNETRTIYGNLLISTGTTVTAGASTTTFAGTSVVQDLTSNGKTLDFPIVIGGTGNTLRLLDAFTQGTTRAFTINSGTTFNANNFSASVGALTFIATPSITNLVSNTLTAQTVSHTAGTLTMSASLRINVTGTYTLTAGTLDLGGQSVSFGGFSSTGSGVRTVNLGSGTLTLTATGTAWASSAGGTFTFNAGTSTVSFTNAGTKTISTGSGAVFYNINQGGAGALTLSSNISSINTLSNSVQPTTILFPSSSTTTVANLNLNGTAGNLVTLGPTTAATAYTVEYFGSTVNTMNFVSVSYFTGARAGIFFATNSTNTAGNTNITFAAADTTPRYWVGGTGSWTNAATANWATSSGGAGGASVPTIQTNVFFDAASNVGTGAFTVTLTGTGTSGIVCNDLTISGLDGTLTWAGSGDLSVYGSLSYPATSFNRTHSGLVTFRSTTTGKTITSNGQQLAAGTVTFNGVGGGWTLADAFNISTALTVTNGTFNTGGFAVTCGAINSSNSNVRTINLGASTVTSSSINFAISTNLTFNAGTSNITLNANGSFIEGGGGQTFFNVTYSSTAITTFSIAGANTFNNLTIAAPASAGAVIYTFSANQTINGTLSCSGATAVRRVSLQSNTLGTQRTLTVNAFTTPTDIDFRDINIAGAASPVSGTRLGNAGGNSNITFDAPKTVYWNLAGTNSFTATAWATTPSGTPAVNNFPLAQDTAVFTDSGAITQVTLSTASISYPTIDMSTRTLAMTINNSAGGIIYGSWTNGSGTTYTSGTYLTFLGRGSHTITSAGKTFQGLLNIDCVSGTYTLTDALTFTSGITITSGTFNSANQTITANDITISGTVTRTVNLGTSTINLSTSTTPTTPWDASNTTGLTFTGSATTINFTSTAVSTRAFQGGGLTYGTLNIGGTTGTGSIVSLNGTGTTFNNITSTKTVAHTITIPSSTTINFNNFNVSGSAGNLVTLTGSSATTSLYNYTGTGVVSVDYVSAGSLCAFRPLPNASGTTPYSWYLGANSTNNAVTPRNSGAAYIAGTRRAYLITDTAARSWTVPSDWDTNNNNFYLIGAGAAGARGVISGNNRAAGGGGGGGGYVGLTNLSLTASSILPVNVGANAVVDIKPFDTYINVQYLAGAGQIGTSATTPTSAGGAGGIGATFNGSGVFYNGGAGGAGAFGTTASQGYGGGGGGGSAGPLGNGGAGGLGFGSTTTANIAGGGGGGNGGGSAGGNGSSGVGGTGGNNFGGTGGGASGTAGTLGGGGGGGTGSLNNGTGGQGLDILNTIGGMGGAGGQGSGQSANTVGFGQGTGGANVTTAGTAGTTPAAGGQGVIFIVYTPLSGIFVSITEAFTSNNTQSAQSVFNRSITENSNLAAAQQATSTFARDITEAITVADNQSVVAIYAGVITEGQGIADNQTVSGIFNVDTTDGLTIASIQSVSANFNSSITEDSTILSVEDAIKTVFSSITENSNLADNQSVFAYFNVTRTENFDPAALQSVQANFNSLINENLVLLDEFVGRGWFRIVNDQTVTWTAINNGQSITWQNIGNDQNPNWVIIDNTQE